MSAERAIRAIMALESLKKLMDLYEEYEEEEPRPKKRKSFVRCGDIETQILKDVTWNSDDSKNAFIPISKCQFENIFKMVKSRVDSHFDKFIISYRMRLAITLRYIIKGESCRTLEKICHISRKSVSRIVRYMLGLLTDLMEDEYLKLPCTQSQWSSVVTDFEKFWQFPHTLGVLDAKRFRINLTGKQHPCHSLVLLSVIDAYGRFLYTETIECDEKTNESDIYLNSNLYKLLNTNTQNIPTESPLKGQSVETEYYFVGAECFGLDRYVLKEYHESVDLSADQKAFNYRLKRVRVVEEMCFKALTTRFKAFKSLNHLDKNIANLVIKACCIIHNYLTHTVDKPISYDEDISFESKTNTGIPLEKQSIAKYEKIYQRSENVCNYCVTDGDLSEQWENI